MRYKLIIYLIVLILCVTISAGLKIDIPNSEITSWVQDDYVNNDGGVASKLSLKFKTINQGLIDRIKIYTEGNLDIFKINESSIKCDIWVLNISGNSTNADNWNILDQDILFKKINYDNFEYKLSTKIKSTQNIYFFCDFKGSIYANSYMKTKDAADYFKLEVDSLEEIKNIQYIIYLPQKFKEVSIPVILEESTQISTWEGSNKIIFNPKSNQTFKIMEDINIKKNIPQEVVVQKGKYDWIPTWWPVIAGLFILCVLILLIIIKIRKGGKTPTEAIEEVVTGDSKRAKSLKKYKRKIKK